MRERERLEVLAETYALVLLVGRLAKLLQTTPAKDSAEEMLAAFEKGMLLCNIERVAAVRGALQADVDVAQVDESLNERYLRGLEKAREEIAGMERRLHGGE